MGCNDLGTKWKRCRAGYYVRMIGGHRFTVEWCDEYKRWECRRDQILFDEARTLEEAKSYCQEPSNG